MNRPSLLLIGAGGHAQACIDVIELQGKYKIAGLVGMPEELHMRILGHPVIATDNDLPQLAKEYQYALIALGQIKTPDIRSRFYREAIKLGFQMPTIVSPIAHVSGNAALGKGTILMHGAIVNACAKVGNNCIVNTRALVEHDAIVEDHCHISTGSILNGNVRIGECSFVGSGSILMEGVILGRGCLVGMGLSVRHTLPDGARFLGDRS